MDVSISIVSYNTRGLLKRCINSIYKYTNGINFEIIVVDNGSKDGTVNLVRTEFPKVKLISNKKNLFFTKANNQALKIARGKYFLILNSDTYFVDNSIKKMVVYMEKNLNVGVCEGLEIYESGKLVPTGSKFSTPLVDFFELSIVGKRFKKREMIDEYRITSKKRDMTFDIEVGCDAFLCVRAKLMKEIYGYDARLLLYYTENDLCLRIKKLGYSIVHLGTAKVIHRVSASVKNIGWSKLDIYYQDLFTYYIKHGYKISGLLLFGLLKFEEVLLKIFRPHTIK